MLMGVEKAAKEQERMKFPFNGPAFTSLSNGRLCKIILSILPKPLFQKKLSGQPVFYGSWMLMVLAVHASGVICNVTNRSMEAAVFRPARGAHSGRHWGNTCAQKGCT